MLLTILTYSRQNLNLLSTFYEWLPALLWANALTLLAQVEIPKEVWGQYPLILIGVALVGWLARYWVANEREWRTFTTLQVNDRESANLRTLQLIQANFEQQLKIIAANHTEQIELIQKTNEDRRREQIALIEGNHEKQLKAQTEGISNTFELEINRVLDLLVKAGHYESKELGRKGND